MRGGNVWRKTTTFPWVVQPVHTLLDGDIVENFSMWTNNSEFLWRIFMLQASRLGYTEAEKQAILSCISREDIVRIITLQYQHSWSSPWNDKKFWAVLLEKLPRFVEDSSDLIAAMFHTIGIIEIYPSRTDETSHLFSVLNHEINHLLLMALYVYRNTKNWISLEETVWKLESPLFDEITETLAWLDWWQLPYMHVINPEKINQYVWWNKWWKYNIDDSYDRAKLRSYRIHKLQMQIHSLPDTTMELYQNWCRKIRDILFAGINSQEYLDLLDWYLDWVNWNFQRARDQISLIH